MLIRLATSPFALSLAVMSSAAIAQTQNCKVNAVDAFRAAQRGGFVFRLIGTDARACKLYDTTLIVTASSSASANCRYLLFGDQEPLGNWKIVRVTFSEGAIARRASEGAGFVLSAQSERGRTSWFSATSLVMRGPECRGALEALDP